MTNRDYINNLNNADFSFFMKNWLLNFSSKMLEEWLSKEYKEDDVYIENYRKYKELEEKINNLYKE